MKQRTRQESGSCAILLGTTALLREQHLRTAAFLILAKKKKVYDTLLSSGQAWLVDGHKDYKLTYR